MRPRFTLIKRPPTPTGIGAKKIRLAVAVLGALSVGACTSLPPPSTVATPTMPAQYGVAERLTMPIISAGVQTIWGCLGDPVVSAAVQTALTANAEIDIAALRAQQAAALYRQRVAEQKPSINAGLRATRQNPSDSERGLAGTTNVANAAVNSGSSYRAELTGRWDLDMAGRLAEQTSAEQARWALAEAQREDTRRRVAADAAVRVLQLRAIEARGSARQDALQAAQELVNLAQRRQSAGLISAAEAARLQVTLNQNLATLAANQREYSEALQTSAYEFGISPTSLSAWLSAPVEQSAASCLIDPGTPSELLARRSDLLAAYHSVMAAVADRRATELNDRPNIVLDTSLGWSALKLASLGAAGSSFSSIAAAFDVKLFDFGRIQAALERARASEREAWLRYQSSARQAVSEVESALAVITTSQTATAALRTALAQQALLVENGRRLQQAGLSDGSALLDALQAEAALREQLADAHFQALRGMALLMRALGRTA